MKLQVCLCALPQVRGVISHPSHLVSLLLERRAFELFVLPHTSAAFRAHGVAAAADAFHAVRRVRDPLW